MTENSRIEDLRRRVQKDPASIAFAQLAEECRRAGEHQEAVDICRSGLEIHPGYLSARVTLGRALIELGELEQAQVELSRVLESAPENLAAIRGLAEIHHRRGELGPALAQYRAALLLARNDPDLEETIADLSRQVEPSKPASSGGLTLEHMQHELLKHAPTPKAPAPQVALPPQTPTSAAPVAPSPEKGSAEKGDGSQSRPLSAASEDAETPGFRGQVAAEKTPVPISGPAEAGSHEDTPQAEAASPEDPPLASAQSTPTSKLSAISLDSAGDVAPSDAPLTSSPLAAFPTAGQDGGTLNRSLDERVTRTVAALEEWLAAIHVARATRSA